MTISALPSLRIALRPLVLAAVVLLSACAGQTFRTAYPAPILAEVTRGWHVTRVTVDTPRDLVVSEESSYLPRADIVWREDPAGDRYAQVTKIMTDAIRRGAQPLSGKRPVAIEVRMTRFHAMTFEAESLSFQTGVHDVEFDAKVVDARTGAVLVPSTHIEASFPAMTGAKMAMARAQGDSQKKQIELHVAATIAGWLGAGPDVRGTFARVGG